MRKLFFYSIAAFTLAACINFSACKKEETPTLAVRLTGKSWKLSKINTGGVDKALNDCQKDDKLTFSAAGDFIWNIGTQKCSGENGNRTGNWTADEVTVTINVSFTNAGSDKFRVTTCDSKTLVYSYEIKPTAGVTQTETLTWLIIE